MIYFCPRCTYPYTFSEYDITVELRCLRCHHTFCGKCTERAHYPASCTELQRWTSRDLETNEAVQSQLTIFSSQFDISVTVLELLDEYETLYAECNTESFVRYMRQLRLYLHQMREIVLFERWYNLHACFNPVLEVLLTEKYSVMAACVYTIVYSIPLPPFSAADLPERYEMINLNMINLGIAVIDLIRAFQPARNTRRELYPGFYDISEAELAEEVETTNRAVALWMNKLYM